MDLRGLRGLLFTDHSRNKPWVVRERRPYNMDLFGGPHGEHLSKLVQVIVWIVDLDRTYDIDFIHNTEVDGRKFHTLGRRGPFSNAERREKPPYDSSTDKKNNI